MMRVGILSPPLRTLKASFQKRKKEKLARTNFQYISIRITHINKTIQIVLQGLVRNQIPIRSALPKLGTSQKLTGIKILHCNMRQIDTTPMEALFVSAWKIYIKGVVRFKEKHDLTFRCMQSYYRHQRRKTISKEKMKIKIGVFDAMRFQPINHGVLFLHIWVGRCGIILTPPWAPRLKERCNFSSLNWRQQA